MPVRVWTDRPSINRLELEQEAEHCFSPSLQVQPRADKVTNV